MHGHMTGGASSVRLILKLLHWGQPIEKLPRLKGTAPYVGDGNHLYLKRNYYAGTTMCLRLVAKKSRYA